MLNEFRYTDSRPDSLVNTLQYLENLCAEFDGRDDTESLTSFLRTYDHISGVVTKRGMMVHYERTDMLQCTLPNQLWRKEINTLGLNQLDPHTFDYCKLKDRITSKISAAVAVAMFEFHPPAAAIPMFLTSPTTPPTAPASIYSINYTALATSPASTVSPTSIASPVPLATTASTSPMAPTSTSASPVSSCSPVSSAPSFSSTPATPKTHTPSPALLVSPAPTASMASTVPLAFAVA
jgi:hypothetical protein